MYLLCSCCVPAGLSALSPPAPCPRPADPAARARIHPRAHPPSRHPCRMPPATPAWPATHPAAPPLRVLRTCALSVRSRRRRATRRSTEPRDQMAAVNAHGVTQTHVQDPLIISARRGRTKVVLPATFACLKCVPLRNHH